MLMIMISNLLIINKQGVFPLCIIRNSIPSKRQQHVFNKVHHNSLTEDRHSPSCSLLDKLITSAFCFIFDSELEQLHNQYQSSWSRASKLRRKNKDQQKRYVLYII